MRRKFSVLVLLILLVSACAHNREQQRVSGIPPETRASPASNSANTAPSPTSIVDTNGTSEPSEIRSAATTATPMLATDFWKDLPIVPEGISDRVRQAYQRGLLMGNNPHAFSKVGDCNSTNPYFLTDYDLGPTVYNLGAYGDLQDTINYFEGSFSRPSLAAKIGLSTAGVLAPLWSDWKYCSSNETPLDCEFRLHRPSFAIVSLGTNEAYDVKKDPSTFEGRLRRIIEHSLDQGVVPILSTKADNDEGNYFINNVTARLAMEYELPFWNFWKAVQPLPQHGMRSSDHLTFAPTKSFTDFSSTENLSYGMQVRNLTALQVLDVIRRSIAPNESPDAGLPAASPTATPIAHQAGETMVSSVDGMTLVYIPAGEFTMGSRNGKPDQAPVHTVSLDGYWLDSTEVTQEMFTKFLNSTGNQVEGGVHWLNPAEPFVWAIEKDGAWQVRPDMKKYPIVGVSWYGANAYCKWAGRQLPTEAQWEFAARTSEGYRFPWGNKKLDCDHARFSQCGNLPVEVDSLALGANALGIYGLAGNVAEWINDRYADDYYEQSPLTDPTGPVNGYYRVIRGGSWDSSYLQLQTWYRDWAGADMSDSTVGFRCAVKQ